MKKTIMTVAIALSALLAMPAFAQNPNSNGTPGTEVSCRGGQCHGERQGNRQAKPKGNRPDPYAGIELSAEQRTALDAIETQRRQARPQRQQQDSVARAQRRQARTDARRGYLDQVKGVLSPDQYVVFLENIVLQQPGHGNSQANGGPRKCANVQQRRTDNHRHHAVNSSQMRSQQRANRK